MKDDRAPRRAWARPGALMLAAALAPVLAAAPVAVLPGLAAVTGAAWARDPDGAAGRYEVRSYDYRDGSVTVPGITPPVPVHGRVIAPAGAPGARPVILFLHGFHDTCYDATGRRLLAWPCPAGTKPADNYLGYEYAQKALAAKGYFTVSADANAITAHERDIPGQGTAARSLLLRSHLRTLASWAARPGSAPWEDEIGAPDAGNVQLVGHSRGGEAVTQVAAGPAASDPWRITAVTGIAPTNGTRASAPTVPGVSVLPSCDGDVRELAGQAVTDAAARYGDGAALHSSLLVTGGVHNFFNTEWTPGLAAGPARDDGGTALCESAHRLSPEQHQEVLTQIVEQVARAFQQGHPGAQAMLQGRAPFPGQAGLVTTAVPVGGDRTFLMNGLGATPARPPGALPTGRAVWCNWRTCPAAATREGSPHWLAEDARSGEALRLTLPAGGTGGLRFTGTQVVRAGDSIETRIVVRGPRPATLRATVRDVRGRAIGLRGTAVRLGRLGAARRDQGTGERDLAQLWRMEVPAGTPAFSIGALDIIAPEASDVALLDVSLARSPGRGTPGGMTAALPSASVALPARAGAVRAGSAGGTITLTVPVRGELTRPAQLAVTRAGDADIAAAEVRWVDVRPGQRTVSLPVITGDRAGDDPAGVVEVQLESRGPLVVTTPAALVPVRPGGRGADPLP